MARALEYSSPVDTLLQGAGPDRYRIAFLITRADDLGGAQVHVRDLSTELHALGHDVVVLTGPQGVLVDQLRDRGIPFRALDSLRRSIRPREDFRAVFQIRRALVEIRPDLLSTHSSKAGTLGRLAAGSLGIPVAFTVHGWSFAHGKPGIERSIYAMIERALGPLASRIVTVSEQDRQLAIRTRVASRERIVTVHNGMPDVAPGLRAAPAAASPRLVMVARFARQKDHPSLLHALSQLADLDWSLELIGDGESRAQIEQLVDSLGMRRRVRFPGFRRDVSSRLARAQIFLLISKWEGFPRSIIEAMRAGLPVVASDVGGVSEAVIDGLTGYAVARGDVEALTDRLRRLIVDPEARLRMGTAGRARYEARFTFDRLVEDTLEVYRAVVADRPDATHAPAGHGRRIYAG